MSGEVKTGSELCREALELRGKATQGEWYHACESILGGNTHVVFTGLDGDLMERGYDGLLRKSSNATPNAAFTIFAANHIKQIAERCLELEKEVEILKNTNKAKKTHTKNCLDYLGGCICGSIERCSTCGSIDFAVARDMKSTRHCVHCSNNWSPGEAMKGGQGG